MGQKLVYSQLVECLVQAGTAAGQQFYFADQPQLRGKQVIGLEAYNALDVATSPVTPGSAVIPATTMIISFLTLFVIKSTAPGANGGELINKMPLTSLHRTVSNATATNSPGPRLLFDLVDTIIQWDKSYVIVSSPGITTTPTLSFLFNVYYR